MCEWSLSTLPNPIPELQHAPLPLQVLWAREWLQVPTPFALPHTWTLKWVYKELGSASLLVSIARPTFSRHTHKQSTAPQRRAEVRWKGADWSSRCSVLGVDYACRRGEWRFCESWCTYFVFFLSAFPIMLILFVVILLFIFVSICIFILFPIFHHCWCCLSMLLLLTKVKPFSNQNIKLILKFFTMNVWIWEHLLN
jgi:hypothetical protein